MPSNNPNTGYTKIISTADIGGYMVTKDYLIDLYPTLANTFKQSGLWVWGKNTFGQLGDNTVTHRSSPMQTVSGGTVWKQVAGGSGHTAAIKTDGTLWLWGFNSQGQLGDGTIVNKSSPVQTVSGGTNWKQVAGSGGSLAGFYGHTAAIKTDGTLWTWGSNSYGELGDNTITFRSSPVQTVSTGTNWKQVSCGWFHMAAIKTDGTLWSWGFNDYGQLGDGTQYRKSSPVQTVSGGTNWKQVSCGGGGPVAGYTGHTAAIKTDGTLWLWGDNKGGQLGDNSSIAKYSPVQTVAGGSDWKLVACGYYHTAAIKTDGTLWTWGSNAYGQLGDNTVTSKSSPVQTVSGGTNWKQVSCGLFHTGAIKTDGALWLWGKNMTGALGTNDSTNRSSPVQTVFSGTNWKQVSCSYEFTVTIRDDSSDLYGDTI